MKTCIESCGRAAASAFIMPWKSHPINSSGNVTIDADSLWIPSVIQPLVVKLSLGLIKTLFWLDTRTSFSGLHICFFLDLVTLLRATFLIPSFCETIAVAFLSWHFDRRQVYFSKLFAWRETAIAWLQNSSSFYLGQLESHLISPFSSMLTLWRKSFGRGYDFTKEFFSLKPQIKFFFYIKS